MIELKLTLTEAGRQVLKEMTELVKKIEVWKPMPWLLGLLISLLSIIILGFSTAYYKVKLDSGIFRPIGGAETEIGEILLVILISLGSIAVVAVLIGFVLKFLIYRPKVSRAQSRLDLLARSPAGDNAINNVHAFLKLQEQFSEFLVLSGEHSPPDWALTNLDKRYVRL